MGVLYLATFFALDFWFLLSCVFSENIQCSKQQISSSQGLCGSIYTTEDECRVTSGCCWAKNSNTSQNTPGTCYKSRSGVTDVAIAPTTRPSYEHCIVYNRSLCSPHLNRSMWDYRWEPRYVDPAVGLTQLESTASLFMKVFDSIDPKYHRCKNIIKTLLCQYKFPPCNARGGPAQFCREDCEAVFYHCEKPMIEVMGAAKVILGQLPPSEAHMGFPNCSAMKYAKDYPKGSDEKCVHFASGLFDTPGREPTCEVYKGKVCVNAFNTTFLEYNQAPRFIDGSLGMEKTEEIVGRFLGVVDAMQSKDDVCKPVIKTLACQYAFLPCDAGGKPIMPCREDCEALFKMCGKAMKEVLGAAEHMFGHEKVRFLQYGQSNCTKLNNQRDFVNGTCMRFGQMDFYRRTMDQSNKIATGLGVGLTLSFVALIAIAVIYKLRKRSREMAQVKEGNEAFTYNALSMRDRIKSESKHILDDPDIMNLMNSENVKQYPLDRVEYVGDLGQGNFGKVFQGIAYGLVGDKPDADTPVAVKTLKEGSSKEIKQAFAQEVGMMALLRHKNIVSLLAVSTEEEPFGMIFEFMNLGDLNQYLRNALPQSELTGIEDVDKDKVILKQEDLLGICKQITLGMEHLRSLRFVHRDLATRNILVGDSDDGLVVKIADFGLSRDVYSSDYYKVEGQAALPIRWLPPEALLYGKFTVDSDVYTYGVVLWEVYTFALQPYYGYTNEEVMGFIKRGVHLGKPDECPGYVYSIMKSCWKKDPAQRPDLKTILAMLDQSQKVLNSVDSPNNNVEPSRDNQNMKESDCCVEARPLYENMGADSKTNPVVDDMNSSDMNQETTKSGPESCFMIDFPNTSGSPKSTYVNIGDEQDASDNFSSPEDDSNSPRTQGIKEDWYPLKEDKVQV